MPEQGRRVPGEEAAVRALRRLDGVLLLDKPLGPSSSAVLLAVKRLLRARKVGHAGTLDPLATGLLPLLFGEATKLAQFGLESAKEYIADVKLGVATDTGDAEGNVVEQRATSADADRLEQAMDGLRGQIEQVPPMYSALKYQGQPLYALARAGQTIERKARQVTVHELELVARSEDLLRLRIRCSKGTYVRQLAVDLGIALGGVAHLAALRRTAIGSLRIEQAVTLEDLQSLGEQARLSWLLPAENLLGGLPRVELDALQVERFVNGQALRLATVAGLSGICQVHFAGERLLGVAEILPGGELQPRRLLASGPEVSVKSPRPVASG